MPATGASSLSCYLAGQMAHAAIPASHLLTAPAGLRTRCLDSPHYHAVTAAAVVVGVERRGVGLQMDHGTKLELMPAGCPAVSVLGFHKLDWQASLQGYALDAKHGCGLHAARGAWMVVYDSQMSP
jgi:hypothetical protein